MRKSFAIAVSLAVGLGLAAPTAAAQPSPSGSPGSSPAWASTDRLGEPLETVVRVRVPSTDSLRRMAADGVDVTHDVAQGPDSTFDATVIVPRDEVEKLEQYGGRVIDTMAGPTQAEVTGELKGNARELTAAQKQRAKPAPTGGGTPRERGADRPPPTAPEATLTVLRADRWTSSGEHFLSVEVRSELGEDSTVTVETDTGETFELSPFVDQGTYLYHRLGLPQPTDGAVMSITVTSSDGASVDSPTTAWAGSDITPYPDGFQWGFTDDGYVDATQADAVIERLAAEFPELTEIIELPNRTHGYNLPDGRQLGAPADYPRDPYTVQALRIGADRDGSKTGVLLYAQEHAREWVTSLVALETAQRLLHNYGSDPTTTALVDDLDIFIVPMINPDGVAYSRYDDLFQRTNMNVDDCDYGVDPTNAGTDLNRNFSVGSLFDGYVGASPDCEDSTYAGSAELSEAESRNEVWLTENYPNIEFAMNTHSYGGYFMWSPASYQPDRTTLPRPDLATEQYFFDASETILSRIKEFRGTVVWPGRTGPVADVLYSAAGNSGDEHFYDDALTNDPDIYAWDFEVGTPLWDETTETWDTTAGGFFWPDFETEGFPQAMEFANGWYGILEVARAYALDDEAPESEANVDGKGTYDGPVDVFFETTEPATVHYTTDGSRPTWDSPTVDQDGVRGGAAPVTLTERRTMLQWFAVDEAGNVEGGYDPDTPGRNGLNREVIKIR